MKRILYGGSSFVTCDHVATELIAYGVELAGHGIAASVDIPVRLDDGTQTVGTVLLGPASQLVIMPEDVDGDLDCEDAADRIREKLDALTNGTEARSTTWADNPVASSMIDPV